MSRNVLVVGAASAIAAACARLWAAQGCSLVLAGRDRARLEDVAADLRVRGARAVHTLTLDVVDTAAHAGMLDAAVAAVGPLDIALLAHGMLPDQAACERDPQLAVEAFTTNATATIALLLRLANHFEPLGRGQLAVITSVAGDRGRPSNFVYGSAKGAVSLFCDGLRARLFRAGVGVTDIRPGFVATPMTHGLDLPPRLVASPAAVGQRIVQAIARRRDVVYAPPFWALVMAVIRAIPRPVFKRMRL